MKNDSVSFRCYVVSAVLSTSLASCGTQNAQTPTSEVLSLDSRFSPSDIQKIYTEATSQQTDVLQSRYVYSNAPAAFKNEWGTFSDAVELKAFFNVRPGVSKKKMITALERVTSWKEIRTADNGEPMFDDAYTVNAGGQKVNDITNGTIDANKETVLSKLAFRMSPLSAVTRAQLVLNNYTDSNGFFADLENTTAINIFPLGELLPVRGFRIHFEVYPYKTGWLVYGVSVLHLERLQDRAEHITSMGMDLILWLREKSNAVFFTNCLDI